MEQAFEIPFELCERQDGYLSVSRRGFLAITISALAAAAYADGSSSVPIPSAGEGALMFIDWPLL